MTDLSARQTAPSFSLRRLRERRPNALVVLGGLAGFAILSGMMLSDVDGPLRFRVDFSLLLRIPLVLQAHIAGAVLSFLIGCVLLAGVKGRGVHKTLGYTWVATISVTAISSFFITGLNGDFYSFIHLLSGWTVIVLPMAIAAARRKDIRKHSKEMTGLFVGGMVVAGLFSFLPGRLMWHLFFQV